jgi:Xaa-Pro aminopeptidase
VPRSPRAGGVTQPTREQRSLRTLTEGIEPITAQEHAARDRQAASLRCSSARLRALLVDAGSTLEYFTGIRWWRSERTTAALIPAEGGVVVVTPFFEEASIRETLQISRRRLALERGRESVRTHRRCPAQALNRWRPARRRSHHALLHHRWLYQGGRRGDERLSQETLS